ASNSNQIVRIAATNSATPGASTFIASVSTADGIAVGASNDPSRPPFLFANRNDGTITRIDLTTNPPTLTDIAVGGSRGDFSAVGPDGCLYATQTDRIVKLTNADGTCSLIPTSAAAQLSLAPTTQSQTVGAQATLTATVRNVANPSGFPVTFTVTGPNARTQIVAADANGVAGFSYRGSSSGTDTVVATGRAGTVDLSSNPG